MTLGLQLRAGKESSSSAQRRDLQPQYGVPRT